MASESRPRCGLLAVEDGGEGEPLVLIHGLATTREIWPMVAPELMRTRRVLTLDMPGFGESPPVGRGFDLERVAEGIARGVAARGVRAPFDLVGHSLGGGIALTLAARRPRLVRRLVLVAPAGLRRFPWPVPLVLPALSDALLAARRLATPAAELRWGRRLLLALAAADGARVTPGEARWMVQASAGARRTPEALAAITKADLRPLLREAVVPLGVIWGSEDRTVPASGAETIRVARPDADVVIIPRAGHVTMIECPGAFADALEQLLSRLPKDATTPSPERTTFA